VAFASKRRFRITESDWRKFKRVKEVALEKICGRLIDDVKEVIDGKNSSNHKKYIYMYELMENYDKRIAKIFDYNSRSKAMMQLVLMRSEGLLDKQDISSFSAGLQDFINRHE